MTNSVDAAPVPRESSDIPDRGQVAAARLILKRDVEGKGNIRITDRIRRYAAYTGYDR
ncbi:MAG TPA: hypothetical protein GXZ46_06800 [Actinomycetales bacterium]|nr:hypothetical protein [Actinomycetales bacterium]